MGLRLIFPSERRYYAPGPPPKTWTLPGGPAVQIGLSYLEPREMVPESRPGNPLWVSKMSLKMADGWPADMPPLLALKQKDRWFLIDGHHRHAAAGQISPVLWLDDTDGQVSRYMADTNTLPLKLEEGLVNFLQAEGWKLPAMKNWPKTINGEKPSRDSLTRQTIPQQVYSVVAKVFDLQS